MAKHKNILWDSKWKLISDRSEKLGQGGQGVVRKVECISTNKVGALKELINFNNVERRKRMHIEAASLAVLEHNHICKLLDSDTVSDGKLFLVTEFIDGETLEDKISRNPLKLEEALNFSKPLLRAIYHAHSVGVFHRDIKPENILLRGCLSENPVLIDFGISFNDEENLFSAATFHGQQLGNRFLHLPELHRRARDPRSDITQLCGVLLYTLTGSYPVSLIDGSGQYPHQINDVRHIIDSLPNNKISKDRLLRVFDKAFQVKLDDRWQTAEELLKALENVILTDMPETNIYGLDEVRRSLESDPSRDNQILILTRSLYSEFMAQTQNVISAICAELGHHLASQKQGDARQDLDIGEFGSHFGVVLPKTEVYLRLNGKLIGEELIMTVQDDETVISRFDARSPNWGMYSQNIKNEFNRRLNEAIQL
jgi:serine/threonine-protein kinase